MSDALADWDAARAKMPGAQPPATVSEVWDANWKEAGLHTLGAGAMFGQARSDIVSAIEAAAGKPLGQYAREQGVTLGAAGTPDENIGELANVAGTLPEDARKRIEPLLDWRRNAGEKAAAIERQAANVNALTYGLSANAVRLAAGVARQAVDPLNIAAMVVTAPIGGEGAAMPLLQVFARQALAGAAAQAIQEPVVQATRAELGLSSGFGEAGEDILGAAAGGAAIGGGVTALLRGGAAALRLAQRGLGIARPEISAPELRPAAELTGDSPNGIAAHPLAAGDLAATARLTERDDMVHAAAPDPSAGGQVVHGRALDQAAAAVEEGRPIAETHAVAPPQPRDPDLPRATRSELARTGDPRIDAILDSPITRNAIDHPVINREGTVPYTAGGSVPLENPEMFVDHRFPRSFTVDSLSDPVGKKVTFDPADPFTVHENIEQHAMGILEAGGMEKGPAYKYAHFKVAEPAEQAWYRANDIDQVKAEGAYAPEMAKIQKGRADRVPETLFKDPYPHDAPSAAAREAIAEPGPTAAEIKQAQGILDKWREQQAIRPEPPAPALSDLPLRTGKPAAAAEPAPAGRLGDPSLAADADRVLGENGGDFKIRLDENGAELSAREALGAADEDAAAARELADCAAMEVAA
jgi:hypothetical protein